MSIESKHLKCTKKYNTILMLIVEFDSLREYRRVFSYSLFNKQDTLHILLKIW